uniref:Retrotransposon Copia-like N-terminal domain-containing protein n=1 Tax=Chenopodium quinoa TaxID=63459 RepID=A0A803LWA6_CHEQI
MAAEEAQVRNNGGNQTTGGNLDPFFIASSDNPISSLVAVQFSGQNFIRWSRSVKRVLVAKNKEGFIT